jgi:hypothetical protein
MKDGTINSDAAVAIRPSQRQHHTKECRTSLLSAAHSPALGCRTSVGGGAVTATFRRQKAENTMANEFEGRSASRSRKKGDEGCCAHEAGERALDSHHQARPSVVLQL